MIVSMLCEWPLSWFIPNDEEQVGILIGYWREPIGDEVVNSTHYSRYGPGICLTVLDVIQVDNPHPDPTNHYAVTVAQINSVAAIADGLVAEVIGIAHTHPPGSSNTPSAHDIDGLPSKLAGVVVQPFPGGRRPRWFTGKGKPLTAYFKPRTPQRKKARQ